MAGRAGKRYNYPFFSQLYYYYYFINLFIYLFLLLAALGLRCCTGLSLVAVSGGFSYWEHRLWAHGLSSCGTWAQ